MTWYDIFWGKEEDIVKKHKEQNPDADPEELTIENAYRTRWVWYHTILGLLLLFTNLFLFGIFLLLVLNSNASFTLRRRQCNVDEGRTLGQDTRHIGT